MRGDRLQHAVEIAEYLVVPEADDLETLRFKKNGAFSVGLRAMLSAVDLHDQSRVEAEEVGDEAVERHLPAKFRAIKLPTAQPRPQQRLRICGVSAQAARADRLMPFRHARPFPLTPMLSHRPSPAKGRGYDAPQDSFTLFEKFVGGLK